MKLLTQDLRRKLPDLYATDGVPAAEKTVVAKFFTPDADWTWYAVEFDGADTFFGYIDGTFGEWGYFSLSELESLRGPMGLPVERDAYFDPQPFGGIGFMRGAVRKSAEYQPGAYDEGEGSGGPYSQGEPPDDSPALPDGYDYDIDSQAPVRPGDTTRVDRSGEGGVTKMVAESSRLWSAAVARGKSAYRGARVAKYALSSDGQRWDNGGEGFELAGSAWVDIPSASPFAKWAAKQPGFVSLASGVRFGVRGRSHDRSLAFARAAAMTLIEAGVPASADSALED